MTTREEMMNAMQSQHPYQSSTSIAEEAARMGEMPRLLRNLGNPGDKGASEWQLGAVRVLATNGNPIWEEQDAALYEEAIQAYGR